MRTATATVNASAYVRSRPLWTLDVSVAPRERLLGDLVEPALDDRRLDPVAEQHGDRLRRDARRARRRARRTRACARASSARRRRGRARARRGTRASARKMPSDAERHGDGARHPLLRRRRVDERLDDRLEPVVERLPDARNREEADDRRPAPRAPRPARASTAAPSPWCSAVVLGASRRARRGRRGSRAGTCRAPVSSAPRSRRRRASSRAPPPSASAKARISSFDKKPAKIGMPTSASEPIRKVASVNGIALRSPPILRMSCSPSRRWITSPAAMKRSALKKACVMRWNIANP